MTPHASRLALAALALALYAALCLAIWLRERRRHRTAADEADALSAVRSGEAPIIVAHASQTGQQLEKNIAAFAKLAKFSPYLAGDTFTLADCGGAVHLQLVASATKIIYGRDFMADLPVRDYLKLLGERPTVQKVNAERKVNTELMLAAAKAKAQAKT